MDWRKSLRDVVLVAVLAIVLIYWGLVVLGLVDSYISLGSWYEIIGRPAILLPDVIAYCIIGATIGTPTGLLFPCHPIRVALLLGLAWDSFMLYSVSITIMGPVWWVFASDGVAVLFFLPLFAYLGARLRRHLPPSSRAHCQGHFPTAPRST